MFGGGMTFEVGLELPEKTKYQHNSAIHIHTPNTFMGIQIQLSRPHELQDEQAGVQLTPVLLPDDLPMEDCLEKAKYHRLLPPDAESVPWAPVEALECSRHFGGFDFIAHSSSFSPQDATTQTDL